MKILKKELVDLLNALDRFEVMSAGGNVFLPGSLSYALKRNFDKIESKFNKEVKPAHHELQEKYVKKDEEGVYEMNKEKTKFIFNGPESEKKFAEDREKLLAQETDFEFYRIPDVDSMMNEIKGNHDALKMLWAIVDEIKRISSGKPKKEVKEETKVEEPELEAVK